MKIGNLLIGFLAVVINYYFHSEMTKMSQQYTDGKEVPSSTSTLTQNQLASEAQERRVDLLCISAMISTEERATVWKHTQMSPCRKI